MENIEQKINQLPKDLQQEVIDFIEFLITRRLQKKKKKAGLGWIGRLKEYREKYNSLELLA
jgi:replication fork clamp-binding protein CrfC